MPEFDASDVAYFKALRAQSAPEAQGLGEYSMGLVHDIPKNVGYSFRGIGQGLWDTISQKPPILRQEEAAQRQAEKPDFMYSSDALRPPQNFLGTTAKIIGEDVLPELPALMMGGGAVTRGAKLLGAGETAAGVVGSMGAGALSGNRDSLGEAGVQAGEFGLMDAAGAMLPKGTRRLFRAGTKALVGGGIPLADQAIRGNDPFTEQNLAQAGVMAAFPFVTEGKSPRKIFKDPLPDMVPADAAPTPLGQGLKLKSRTPTEDGRWKHVFEDETGATHEAVYPSEVGNPSIPSPRDDLGSAPIGEGDVFGRIRHPDATYSGEAERADALAQDLEYHRQTEPRLRPSEPISVEPQGEAVPIGATEPPVPPATRLRPLSRESAAIARPLLQNLAATSIGAGYGYATGKDDDDKIRRALMFGGTMSGMHLLGYGTHRLGTKLFAPVFGEAGERAAAGQLGKKGQGKSVAGLLRRFGENYLKMGQSGTVDTLMEQSRQAGQTIMEDVAKHADRVIPAARTMTPAQWGDYALFTSSDRGAGAQAIMRRTVPAEVADFAIKSSEAERKLQQIHADAQPPGSPRRAMFENSIRTGNYQTKPYMAFEDSKAWQARGVDPTLEAQILTENRTDPRFAHMTEEARISDWNAYKKDIQNFGGNVGKYSEGGKRISESLFTARKVLRPSMEKFLGLVENPMQRQILTVHKLAKGAATAKAVAMAMDHTLVDEHGFRPAMSHPEFEAEIAASLARGDVRRAEFLRSNYDEVPDSLKGVGMLAGEVPPAPVMAQRQVLDALQIGAGHEVFSNDHTFYAMLNRIPKGAHTILSPSTHVHNMIQIPMMGALARLWPWEIVTHNMRNDPKRTQWAREDGITTAHMGVAEFKKGEALEHVLNPTAWQSTKKAGNKLMDSIKRLYGLPDRLVRVAKYNKELDRAFANGLSEKAARTYATEITNRTTHNYTNVPQAVKVLRNIPLVNSFITFTTEMARTLKNAAYDVIEDPMAKKYGPWASQKWGGAQAMTTMLGMGAGLSALIESFRSDDDKEKYSKLLPFLPAYQRGKTQPLLGRKNGVDTTYNLNPLLPAEDFVTMAKNVANGDWEALAKNNPIAGVDRSPAINFVAELSSGKDAMGRPSRGILRNVAQNMLPGWFPGNYQAEKLKQGFTRNDKGELGVTDSTGREETPMTAVGSLFGINLSRVNEHALIQRHKQEQKDAESQAKSDAKRILRSNTNAEEKAKAMGRYHDDMDRIRRR